MSARHVLVPLIVLALALALFFWRGFHEDPRPDLPADVERCTENLRAIYTGLLEYKQRTGHAPQGSGIAFLAALIADGAWQDTAENRARLTCPGAGADPMAASVDFGNPGALSAATSAYAARNTSEFPLAKFPSGGAEIEPLVACDNHAGLNHEGCMNVLYSDGSVVVLRLEQEIEAQRLPAGMKTIAVGKGSPIADLAKLVGD